jgi:hypothetical protein
MVMSSEKIQITTTPALPSQCAVCHTHAKGVTRFIDFGSDIDFYGAIVICELCIVNAAEELGTLVPVAKWKLEESMRLLAYEEMASLREKVKALESLIASYGFDRHISAVANSGSDDPLPLGEADEGSTNGSDQESSQSESGLTEPATV